MSTSTNDGSDSARPKQDRAADTTSLNDEASSTFEALESDPIDRSVVISDLIKDFAWWCVRILVIFATALGAGWLATQFWKGLLPLILALLVSSVLVGPTKRLRKLGVPAGLAAILVLLAAVALLAAIVSLIAPSMIRQSQTLYLQTLEAVQRFQLWLQGPPLNLQEKDLTEAFQSGTKWLQEQSGNIAGELFAGLGAAASVMLTLVVVLVLTFFFLKDGERFLPWMRSFTGRRVGWHLTELLSRIWVTLSGYIRVQAVVSFIDAFFIGLGLVVVGVPLALALAVLTFLAGFIPIVGAFVAGALAVVVALVSLGIKQAIIILIIVLAVQQLEGNVLQPMLQSKAMNLHPVIVLVSVTIGGSLFNIIGAFLAVPFAATVAVILRYISDVVSLRSGEKRAEDISFITQQGSISGKHTEKEARERRTRLPLPLRFSSNDGSDDDSDNDNTDAAAKRSHRDAPNFIANLFDNRSKK
ncbi:AI-2E family transporter [Corynebacterium sp. TAE3-ERU2]|uniref:AI-2E family transporter n=1 Tax=Corynebacterium sp. TAE3-ERU2 TaxID=2849497 RepID=UPI001C461274|nr:AI-2E family transporter [Corynebacterium sp. TAE3-ERU2]